MSCALALIADGALDNDDSTVAKLSERLGIGERQLRRLFEEHLGASPIAVAQTRRVLFAKQLIHEKRMPMTEIALAAGFGSLRRFNEVFRELFDRPPRSLRRDDSTASVPAKMGVTLRLRYRPPYDWDSMLAYLEARAIPGVEVVEGNSYRRTIEIDGAVGFVPVFHLPQQHSLGVAIRLALTVGFIVLRGLNAYGNPSGAVAASSPGQWHPLPATSMTIVYFLDVEKYPPSLQFLLMTIGPSLALLGWLDRCADKFVIKMVATPLLIFGRVSLFFYMLHLYVIHLLAIAVAYLFRRPVGWLWHGSFWMNETPDAYGHSLPFVYAMWLLTVGILYFPCCWFANLKQRRKDWWLSYL